MSGSNIFSILYHSLLVYKLKVFSIYKEMEQTNMTEKISKYQGAFQKYP